MSITSLIPNNALNCCVLSFNPYITPIYRCRGCNNFASSSPASIYQKQKIIQNTVRVASSLYTSDLASLKTYQTPDTKYDVNWKQMSDRRDRHIQKTVVPTQLSTKRAYTWLRPGYLSPGGSGVDMKHNSYQRYLNRIKGKGPSRRGVIGKITPEIPFNVAFPVYGGKTFKTNIVSNYNCPICSNSSEIYSSNEQNIYNASIYSIGDMVLVFNNNTGNFENAKIIAMISSSTYKVEYDDGTIVDVSVSNLQPYPVCIKQFIENCNNVPCNNPIILTPYKADINPICCNDISYVSNGYNVF